jgi:hypothetical protein
MSATFEHTSMSAIDATHRATAALYAQLVQSATTLAYLDTLRVMAFATAFMIPILLFAKKPKPGKVAPGGH